MAVPHISNKIYTDAMLRADTLMNEITYLTATTDNSLTINMAY